MNRHEKAADDLQKSFSETSRKILREAGIKDMNAPLPDVPDWAQEEWSKACDKYREAVSK